MSEMQLKEHAFHVGQKKFTILNDSQDGLLGGSLGSSNTWEPWQLILYSAIIQSDFVCLDIGGNIGTSALAMAHYAQTGHIYTFEPVSHTHSILTKNLKNNDVFNATAFNIGVSNKEGEERILVNRRMLGNARQVDINSLTTAEMQYTETFQTQTIDGWMEQQGIDHVDFIKVDVEGFEIEVLEGGQKAFFGSNRTIAILEFAIQPQRGARPQPFPEIPRDVSFFHKLKSSFKYIFLIGRDAKLHPVRDYAHLRFMMLAGYPVEDLLCCHIIPQTILGMIATSYTTAANVPTRALAPSKLNGTAVIYNRGQDGWTFPSPHGPGTRSGVQVVLSEPATIQVNLPAVSAHASKLASHTVLLVVGDREYFIDVLDRSAAFSFHLPAGVTYIFAETDNTIQADSYFNNPNDQRKIGVRLNLPDLEFVL